jgi:hypothetical protein
MPGILPALPAAMNKPKSILLCGAAAAAIVGALSFPAPSSGQAPDDARAIAALVTEIAGQHDKMAANQQAMEIKIASIEENLRLARIFTTRRK